MLLDAFLWLTGDRFCLVDSRRALLNSVRRKQNDESLIERFVRYF